MNRGVILQRNSSRNKPRVTSNWNMKNSAPAYSISSQKPSGIQDKKGNGGSYISSKNAFNYDYSNTALKSLLKDKNIPDTIVDRHRESQKGLFYDSDAKKDSNKKQFRIRQNAPKDGIISSIRKTEKDEEQKQFQKTVKRESELTSSKLREEKIQQAKKSKQSVVMERGSSRLYVLEKKSKIQSQISTATGGSSPQKRFSMIYPSNSSKSVRLVGLNNIGNTCFMNSILQCMFNLPYFNEYFLEGSHLNQMKSNARVAEAYARTIKTMRSSNSNSQTPSDLKNAIGAKRSRFLGYAQQDAQQFLAALLQLLSLDLNRAKNPKYKQLTADTSKHSLKEISNQWWTYNKQRQDSIVCDFFSGQVLSRVVCCRCNNQSIAFDNIWDMALNFSRNDNGDILKMIQNFLKEETISEDYYCSKCKTFRQCKRKIDFYRLPKIMVLQIKRFSYGSWRKTKLNNRLKVETTLDLTEAITKSDHHSVKNPIYELVGVVNHSGGIDFGHYTAECRNPINGKWYNFNDSSVHQIRMREDFESSSPYVLFYAKRDM